MTQRIFNALDLRDRRRQLRGNQTNAERILWSRLRNRQLRGLKFRRQFSVGPYILDFYCPKLFLAIEVDGGQHVEHAQYDERREIYLRSKNIQTLRFWNNEVLQNIDGVLEKIMSALDG